MPSTAPDGGVPIILLSLPPWVIVILELGTWYKAGHHGTVCGKKRHKRDNTFHKYERKMLNRGMIILLLPDNPNCMLQGVLSSRTPPSGRRTPPPPTEALSQQNAPFNRKKGNLEKENFRKGAIYGLSLCNIQILFNGGLGDGLKSVERQSGKRSA